jgi:hypothetical protein
LPLATVVSPFKATEPLPVTNEFAPEIVALPFIVMLPLALMPPLLPALRVMVLAAAPVLPIVIACAVEVPPSPICMAWAMLLVATFMVPALVAPRLTVTEPPVSKARELVEPAWIVRLPEEDTGLHQLLSWRLARPNRRWLWLGLFGGWLSLYKHPASWFRCWCQPAKIQM